MVFGGLGARGAGQTRPPSCGKAARSLDACKEVPYAPAGGRSPGAHSTLQTPRGASRSWGEVGSLLQPARPRRIELRRVPTDLSGQVGPPAPRQPARAAAPPRPRQGRASRALSICRAGARVRNAGPALSGRRHRLRGCQPRLRGCRPHLWESWHRLRGCRPHPLPLHGHRRALCQVAAVCLLLGVTARNGKPRPRGSTVQNSAPGTTHLPPGTRSSQVRPWPQKRGR